MKSFSLARKKMPPLKRKGEIQDKKEDDVKENQEIYNNQDIENFAGKTDLNKDYNEIDQENLPEILKKSDNPQIKINYHRMRLRNFTDGAVSINLQIDDLANENLELYDHKGINIEPEKFNENIIDSHEAYVESLHLQKYFKINPIIIKNQEIKNKEITKTKQVEKQPILEKNNIIKENIRRTEDEVFLKFDHEMKRVVEKISNMIAIFFLFCQGLLAGICLTNIFLLFEFANLKNFTTYYALFSREVFNFIYFLTFVSLIGNGVKSLNIYKKYNPTSYIYGEQDETAKLKKSLIYSLVIFFFYLSSFCIQLYIIRYIPKLFFCQYSIAINKLIIDTDFYKFAACSATIAAISLINFIINIIDVEKVNKHFDLNESTTIHSYDPNETREPSD